ncbi:hypothetical protein E5Q_06503 [Mixia osmundae IAM 14324]|uniref:Uncharacterized protein n=1 Tax=Mixia osmundae (strain CBS 9802 / IAM 14324 / JCM 22182 / KY 12970) TaxID=764103 RepID=G7EAE0_MIXOS|nr:hypothetical protein E5Q_06503 [Mixia osmundae IAM 14324]
MSKITIVICLAFACLAMASPVNVPRAAEAKLSDAEAGCRKMRK